MEKKEMREIIKMESQKAREIADHSRCTIYCRPIRVLIYRMVDDLIWDSRDYPEKILMTANEILDAIKPHILEFQGKPRNTLLAAILYLSCHKSQDKIAEYCYVTSASLRSCVKLIKRLIGHRLRAIGIIRGNHGRTGRGRLKKEEEKPDEPKDRYPSLSILMRDLKKKPRKPLSDHKMKSTSSIRAEISAILAGKVYDKKSMRFRVARELEDGNWARARDILAFDDRAKVSRTLKKLQRAGVLAHNGRMDHRSCYRLNLIVENDDPDVRGRECSICGKEHEHYRSSSICLACITKKQRTVKCNRCKADFKTKKTTKICPKCAAHFRLFGFRM